VRSGYLRSLAIQILLFEALRIAERQRRIQQWAADRAPQIDDREAMLQQFFGLLAHQLAHALGGRPSCIVVVERLAGILTPLTLIAAIAALRTM